MHPDRRVERFCRSYARYGNIEHAAWYAGHRKGDLQRKGELLLDAPGARARLAEIHVENGRKAMQDRAGMIGKLEALFGRLFEDDPAAAAKTLALQVRVARDMAAAEREQRRAIANPAAPGPGRAATQFKPGAKKRVLVPGKLCAENTAPDSVEESASTVVSSEIAQPIEATEESVPTVDGGSAVQPIETVSESTATVEKISETNFRGKFLSRGLLTTWARARAA